MLFNSFHFLVFFTVVTCLYFLLPQRGRWPLLLLSSCYFYMVFVPIYILVLGFTIVVDYFAGLLIERSSGGRRRTMLLCSLVANIGVLAFFKYYNFLNDNLTAALGIVGIGSPMPFLHIILPIGLSFHTFQAMSYTIEVYRGNQRAEKNFGIYALYVMFYPQLVAGPIERPQNLLHQFREHHRFDYQRVTDGIKLMAWGLFKKAVIADRLAVLADRVFDKPEACRGPAVLVGVVCFAFQIFCDFSGYSDMAIGAAQVMGFRLMTNFRRPYFANSIADFWGRWHISLTTWFRDYVFVPLCGKRATLPRIFLSLIIVFLLSGLWHGAAWHFVVWGGLYGLYLVVGKLTQTWRTLFRRRIGLERFPGLLWLWQAVCVFALVCVASVFFRVASLSDAFCIFGRLTAGWHGLDAIRFSLKPLHVGTGYLLLCGTLIGFMECVHLWQEKRGSVGDLIRGMPVYVRWTVYYASFFILLFLGLYEKRQFIYFQF